jgi:hypothetical protein
MLVRRFPAFFVSANRGAGARVETQPRVETKLLLAAS